MKLDISKIEGYADMTPEQKLAALEGYEIPDPDYSGFVSKETFDRTASELAAKKKELAAKMTEDEKQKQAEQEARDAFFKAAEEAGVMTAPSGKPGENQKNSKKNGDLFHDDLLL